jgi:phosphopantothenoylcysteine decarboxylase/phosphopantothenate--cysteine ligase
VKILITAGPTREPIDPVRYLSNRSSGKMGYALAAAAVEMGHEVTMVTGPVSITPPPGVETIRIETAQEMFDAVSRVSEHQDIAILAAAVADYRPVVRFDHKIKKQASSLHLELERTPDILGSMRSRFHYDGYLVGFAAETENLVANALDKVHRKNCDLIVANDVSRRDTGFDSDENEVILCFPSGQTEPLPQQSKQVLAQDLILRIIKLAAEKVPS